MYVHCHVCIAGGGDGSASINTLSAESLGLAEWTGRVSTGSIVPQYKLSLEAGLGLNKASHGGVAHPSDSYPVCSL